MRRLTILLGEVENIYRGLSFFSVVALGFYFLGNYQSFLDSTQIMLIKIVQASALIGAILGLYVVIYRVIQIGHGRRYAVVPLVENAVVLSINLVLVFGLKFLQSWLQF